MLPHHEESFLLVGCYGVYVIMRMGVEDFELTDQQARPMRRQKYLLPGRHRIRHYRLAAHTGLFLLPCLAPVLPVTSKLSLRVHRIPGKIFTRQGSTLASPEQSCKTASFKFLPELLWGLPSASNASCQSHVSALRRVSLSPSLHSLTSAVVLLGLLRVPGRVGIDDTGSTIAAHFTHRAGRVILGPVVMAFERRVDRIARGLAL